MRSKVHGNWQIPGNERHPVILIILPFFLRYNKARRYLYSPAVLPYEALHHEERGYIIRIGSAFMYSRQTVVA